MDIQLIVLKVLQTMRERGLWATFGKAFAYLWGSRALDDFDVRCGTDTGRVEPLWRLQISSPNRRYGTRYEATDAQELVDAINFLNETLHTFTFVDVGCGKGRTLLVASDLGFQRIIGVEFASELVEIARKNLAKMKIANAVVEHADAVDFCFPNSNMVVYFYNPFSQEVMRKVITRLRESGSRRLYVIYKNPAGAEVLDSSAFLSRFGCPPQRPYIQVWRATA